MKLRTKAMANRQFVSSLSPTRTVEVSVLRTLKQPQAIV